MSPYLLRSSSSQAAAECLTPPNNILLATPVQNPTTNQPVNIPQSNKNPESVVMASNTKDFLNDIGVDISTLSPENGALVHVLIGGIRKLLDRQFEVERQEFKATVEGLENQVSALRNRCDDLENYGRRNTIVLSGSSLPHVTRDENCIDIATNVIKDRLGIQDFVRTDIDVAHRLGKPRAGSADNRNIIVKLVRRENKRRIFNACRIKKPLNLYLNESVSKTRSTILYVLRKAAKDFPTKFGSCFTEDGNIRVRIPLPEDPTNSTRETVNTKNALDTLLRTKINADSSKYEPRWNP